MNPRVIPTQSGSRWHYYERINLDGFALYEVMRAVGLRPRFTRFERVAGRLIAFYAVWKAVTR